MSRIYFFISKIFYSLGCFHGSSRILLKISNLLPIKSGMVRHHLGFLWMISSRDSLGTYLSSCESFTTKLVLSQAPELDAFICVGANRGWYPLVIGVKNQNARIVAFECNSSIYAELTQNVIENGNHCELYPFAIGEDRKSVV